MTLNINYVLRILFFSLLTVACGSKQKEVKNEEREPEMNFTCNNFDCIQENKNSQGAIEGFFRKYTPNKIGKGANTMFWDWELVLTDSLSIPVVGKYKSTDLSVYEDMNVSIYGNIFYGVIIGGSSNLEEQGQAATGYRIDAISFHKK